MNLPKVLFSLALLVIPSQPCMAEIYKCGKIWSSKECVPGADPVAALPAISRPGLGDRPHPSSEDRNLRGSADNCVTSPSGINLLLRNLYLERQSIGGYTQTVITGIIVNPTSEQVISGISIELSQHLGHPLYVEEVVSQIGPHQSTTFTIIRNSSIHPDHQNMLYLLRLLYSPAARCEYHKVSGAASLSIDSDSKRTGSSFAQLKQHLRTQQKQILEDAKKWKRVYGTQPNLSQEAQAERRQIYSRLGLICAKTHDISEVRLIDECSSNSQKIRYFLG